MSNQHPDDQAILNRMADNGCALSDLDAVARALRTARVVGVLDAWAGNPLKSRAAWYTATSDDMSEWRCTLYPENGTLGAKHYFGQNPDAARAAAAEAIQVERCPEKS